MKTKCLIIGVFGLIFLMLTNLTSCDDKQKQGSINGKPILTHQETVNQLNQLAYELAANEDWITSEVLNVLEKTALKLSAVQLNFDAPSELAKTDPSGSSAAEYYVTLEAFLPVNFANLNKSLSGSAYYIALDPDQFYREEDPNEELWASRTPLEIPAYYFDGDSPVPLEKQITLVQGVSPSDPVFFITLKQIMNEPLQKESATPGHYLAYYGLDLRYDTDDGNEEFEAYVATGTDPINSPFPSTTTHLFDGTGKYDASSTLRNYPDINYIESGAEWDVDTSQAICLKGLDGNMFRLTPIEDDAVPGTFARDNTAGTLSSFNIDYYKMDDGSVVLNVPTNYIVGQRTSKNDDRYASAGVTNINESNLTNRMGGQSFMQTDQYTGQNHLTNLNWKLGRKIIP